MICKCITNDCPGYLELKIENEIEIYICNKCGKRFQKCNECEGEGFAQTENGIFDCEECQGTGILNFE